MRRVFTFAGVIALVAACASGIRPAWEPFPQAVSDTLNAPPPAVVEALVSRLVTSGLRIQWQSTTEGYIETQWYDVVSRQSGSYDQGRRDQYVRLRFFVDPVGTDRSAVVAEAVILGSMDVSRPEREREMLVQPGSAGHEIVTRILRETASGLGR